MSRAHPVGRGGGERMQRRRRGTPRAASELPVLGPEVVAPVADAVRLVDRDDADAALLEHVGGSPGCLRPAAPARRTAAGSDPRGSSAIDAVALGRRTASCSAARPRRRRPAGRRPGPSSARSAARRPARSRGRRRRARSAQTSAGAWKQSDLPPPVGSTTTLSRPSSTACIASRCSGRKSEKPQMRCSTSSRSRRNDRVGTAAD